MDVLKQAKENPLITSISVLGSLGVIVGAVYFVEDRYAHASEVQRQYEEVRESLQNAQKEQLSRKEFLEYQEKQLEDQIFELDLKINRGEANDYDMAVKKRYEDRLQQLRQQR